MIITVITIITIITIIKVKKGKVTFLYSAVPSPWHCSKRFTLHHLTPRQTCSLHFTTSRRGRPVLYTSPPHAAADLFFTLHHLTPRQTCSLHFTTSRRGRPVLYTSPPHAAADLFFTLHHLTPRQTCSLHFTTSRRGRPVHFNAISTYLGSIQPCNYCANTICSDIHICL